MIIYRGDDFTIEDNLHGLVISNGNGMVIVSSLNDARALKESLGELVESLEKRKDVKFNKNLNNEKIWVSEDGKWTIIQRDVGLLLYVRRENEFFNNTGFIGNIWRDIQDYIENHSEE